MSEISETAAARTLTVKIGCSELGNIAMARLYQILDRDLSNIHPDPEAVEEAEFLIAIKKAIANKCSRIVIEIEATDD